MTKPASGGVLLVGSVPLHDAEEVFRTIGPALGDRIDAIPDGETGARAEWIVWQYSVLSARPEFEVCPPGKHAHRTLPQLRLRGDADASSIEFGDLGYAKAAISSYAVFARLKRQEIVPAHCRFQVALPTPLAPVAAFVSCEHRAFVEPRYEEQLLRELRAIVDAIPHDQLSVQWDANLEFAILDELIPSHFDDPTTGIAERLARLAAAVPTDVRLGYHFCHNHERLGQPRRYNAKNMVRVATALFERAPRQIDWIHVPLQGDRVDVNFLDRLALLALPTGTRLYLGVINPAEGIAGAAARLAAAQRYLNGFGVATACGWGRFSPRDVEPLLDLHRAIAAPVHSPPTARTTFRRP